MFRDFTERIFLVESEFWNELGAVCVVVVRKLVQEKVGIFFIGK